MNFKLKRSLFEILKNIQGVNVYILDIQDENDDVSFKIKKENVEEVQLLVNDEIVSKGIDGQETVNDIGIKLYKLYDEILYQKKNNK